MRCGKVCKREWSFPSYKVSRDKPGNLESQGYRTFLHFFQFFLQLRVVVNLQTHVRMRLDYEPCRTKWTHLHMHEATQQLESRVSTGHATQVATNLQVDQCFPVDRYHFVANPEGFVFLIFSCDNDSFLLIFVRISDRQD